MRRSRRVAVGAISAMTAAVVLAGCGGEPDTVAVCVDEQGTRIDDDQCDDDDGSGGGRAHIWHYYRAGSRVPAVGQRSTGAVTDPKGAVVQRGGAPRAGGAVAKGGFGGRGSGGSGFGG